jgi:hypothetical protein
MPDPPNVPTREAFKGKREHAVLLRCVLRCVR